MLVLRYNRVKYQFDNGFMKLFRKTQLFYVGTSLKSVINHLFVVLAVMTDIRIRCFKKAFGFSAKNNFGLQIKELLQLSKFLLQIFIFDLNKAT